jgi:hypothetical protein
MSRGDTAGALEDFAQGVTLAESLGHPSLLAQALTAQAAAQAAINDPAAVATYRRALGQAKSSGDHAGEAHAALGLGQLLVNQGGRIEGSQMLQEAAAAARRIGARGSAVAKRADELLSAVGPLEMPPIPERPSRRRETTERQRQPQPAPSDEAPASDITPAEQPRRDPRDAVYRETTLPPA